MTVIASENTTVLEISRDDLIKMRQEAPRVAAALVSAVFHEVIRRLRSVDERVDRDLRAESEGSTPGPQQGEGSRSSPGRFPRLRGLA